MANDYSSEPDATIIVAQHGGSELTISCLQSIRQHERTNWPMIVVDDGSDYSERQRLLAAFSKPTPGEWSRPVESLNQRKLGVSKTPSPATLLENMAILFQEHRYLTAAWNCAAKLCQTRILVFLNNDVTVCGDFVERLIAPLKAEEAMMTGVRFRKEKAFYGQDPKCLPTTRFLEGWCFAIKKVIFDWLGGFDPKMKLYFSDTDLQLRIVEVTGSSDSLREVPDLPLKHLGHRTAHRLENRNAIWQQDRRFFLYKWNESRMSTPVAAQRELRPPVELKS